MTTLKHWLVEEITLPEPTQNTMQKLTSSLKRILSKDLQAQYKAGLRNGNLELTDTGRNELLEILSVENQDKLTAVAKEIIEEDK